jgi:2-oxoglutarate ferredoxin oxidoreductase subunit alpha
MAGCRFFFGYPITPQNQIPEYMSARMPEVGGCFLQAESEVAAINMVYGAAGACERAMTSSSSPGISLKQEGISYIACTELPCVIVNMMRSGPGLGGILATQGDYFQACKGGGHGDYHLIVYAPASVQEAADLVIEGFETADFYRIPVMILGDGMIGQMMEPVEFQEAKKRKLLPKDWAATGWDGKSRPRAVINSLHIEADEMDEVCRKLELKYKEIEKNETQYEEYKMEDAEVCVVAYGTVARICKVAVNKAREQGIKAGLIRPVTVWPFPVEPIARAADKVKGFLTVEMSMGQMVEDVRLAVNGKKPVDFYGTVGGIIPDYKDVLQKIKAIKEGK